MTPQEIKDTILAHQEFILKAELKEALISMGGNRTALEQALTPLSLNEMKEIYDTAIKFRMEATCPPKDTQNTNS